MFLVFLATAAWTGLVVLMVSPDPEICPPTIYGLMAACIIVGMVASRAACYFYSAAGHEYPGPIGYDVL